MIEERTMGQLVDDATRDLSDIVRAELALARAELREEAMRAGAAGGMFASAGYLGYLASITGVLTVGFLLAAIGLPLWASFAVVTLGLILLAAGLVFWGRNNIERITPPTRTIEQARATITLISGRRGRGSSRRSTRSRTSPPPEPSAGTDVR
jgi:hypothetical protein